ncbi:hypothetical protein STAS_23513 [Striga asiatica]|uniref:Uncharacterized protein n=1 Tax=Striga asiatica TaxID=4170 RepID=A0A5A7QNG9_STRAF|nr:hypothetical protein STAS_23513 [Striga asiatica]
MASTAPAKSQPLHNFALPHLKWNKDAQPDSHHHHHQRRRSIKSPSRRPTAPSSSSPVRHSPLRESVSATPPRHQSPLSSAPPSLREFPVHNDSLWRQPVGEWARRSPIAPDQPLHLRRHDPAPESRSSGKGRADSSEHQRFNSKVPQTIPERGTQKFETKSKAKEADEVGIARSKKILIKIPFRKDKTDDETPPEEPPKIDKKIAADEAGPVAVEGKINSSTDEETKIWNLRPRKPIRASPSENWAMARNIGPAMAEKSKGQSPSNGDNGQKKAGGEKKVKRKLSVFISLTKEEIEEDIFSFTGSKPARRPKKRAKNVQRQVDTLFPGAWLMSITADSYKVVRCTQGTDDDKLPDFVNGRIKGI